MNTFRRKNRDQIRAIFQEKTGVELKRRRAAPTVRAAVVLAAVLVCCTVTALAASGLFSVLDGDDLALSAVYEGNGVVRVQVENRSDKVLQFQSTLKLMRWTTGEVAPLSDGVEFQGTRIAPRSSGVLTIDLSRAYDLEQLEQPLQDDWYYFVLTNHNFLFGQDWMCSVEFAETEWTPVEYPQPGQVDAAALAQIPESLQFYFETVTYVPQERQALDEEYVQAYTKLLAEFEGNVVPSVSPVLPGNRISSEQPYLLVGAPDPGVVFDEGIPQDAQYALVGENFQGVDANFKLLAAQGEYALVLSADLPSARYGDTGNSMPLFYLFTYEKSAITGPEDCAFLYGRLVPFAELEPYQVYEDEQYVCYEVSGLIYSDLLTYAEDFAAQNPDVLLDERTWTRLENIYRYYSEHLPELLFWH